MRQSHLDSKAMVSMVVLCAIWGLTQPTVKIAAADIGPVLQGGLRGAISAVLVLAWTRLQGPSAFRALWQRDGSLKGGLLAGFLFAAEFAVLFKGLEYTQAARAVLFLYSAPFVVALGGHLWLGERLGRMQWLGLTCAFVGLGIGMADSLTLSSGTGGTESFGDLLALIAGVLWGATTLSIRLTRVGSVPPAKTLLYQLVASVVLMTPLGLMMGEPWPDIATLSAPTWAAVLFQGVVISFASYLVWFSLVSRYPAGLLSAFSFLTPLFGMLFGALLLGERLTPLFLVAACLVGGGIWLVNRRPSAGQGPSAPPKP